MLPVLGARPMTVGGRGGDCKGRCGVLGEGDQQWMFNQAWEYSASMDSSVIIVDKTDSGRWCPSGREVWMEDVMTVMDRCIQLPGEISQYSWIISGLHAPPGGAQR